ncbi:primosomal protein N' [Corynebacterium gerontici]|uniref:Probable replication restart protein PriA n=1 Tax=Corynebacterium gerontici TaxID=2079234 RepID=A0A3G6J0L5_9CORY|nr:primosomal protein N' [Corynebacterium gerontici]AZA11502.1 Primosomal protein N' [Corynebacterium gerontici]
MSYARTPAPENPVAHVLPLLGISHLDRAFEYLITAEQHHEAKPGVRLRVKFSGRLVDAILLHRSDHQQHQGKLAWVERVISPEVVYPKRTRELVESLTVRYAGVTSDLIRLVVPPRHAKAEESDTHASWESIGEVAEPDLAGWLSFRHGQSFVDAVLRGAPARAAWQLLPCDPWMDHLGALATKVAIEGGGVLIVLPDQREVDAMEEALRRYVGAKQVTVLNAAQGPQARYRRYLSILHGQARIVVGTRSAAFAPVKNLRLTVIEDDGDENLVEPRAPYYHAREVLSTRSAQEHCALLIAGYARTAETQLLVESGWCHDLVAPPEVLKAKLPQIEAIEDSAFSIERDHQNYRGRIPAKAFRAMRTALDSDSPVLVQVARKGYIPGLSCARCRTPARCRACNGPLSFQDQQAHQGNVLTCRWCGRPETAFACVQCGHHGVRAQQRGSVRTAEEIGRAYAGTPVVVSGGNRVIDHIEHRAQIVVATPGAEPRVDGGYGAVVLLDAWMMLGREDLRASEDVMRTWSAAIALGKPAEQGGTVVIAADNALAEVQALLLWNVVGMAARELQLRRQVHFPPAYHMAAIDAPAAALEDFLELAQLPPATEILGPVDLPRDVHLPGEYDQQVYGPAQRILLRTPLQGRNDLGQALRAARVQKQARKNDLPLRIQIDPIRVG